MSAKREEQDELREVRLLLQGALDDLETERSARAVADRERREAEQRLESVTAHRDRLLEEKRLFQNWTIADDGPAR